MATHATSDPLPATRRGFSLVRRGVGSARRLLLASLSIVLLLAVWEVGVRVFDVQEYLLPPPSVVFDTIVDSWHELLDQSIPTVIEASLGLLIGSVVAFATAVFVQRSKIFELTVLPFTVVLQSVPIVAITPVIALIVGRNHRTAVIVVALVAYFPVLVNSIRGLLAVSDEGLELFHVTAASRSQELWLLRLPTSLPYVFGGLRVSAAFAIPAALVAEWTTSSSGLGFFIVSQAALYDTNLVWAGIVVATVLAAAAFVLVVAVERVVLARLEPTRASESAA